MAGGGVFGQMLLAGLVDKLEDKLYEDPHDYESNVFFDRVEKDVQADQERRDQERVSDALMAGAFDEMFGRNEKGGNDMAVIQAPRSGGLFSSILPKLLGVAGTAIGGPLGGGIGSTLGGIVGGQNPGTALVNGAADYAGDSILNNLKYNNVYQPSTADMMTRMNAAPMNFVDGSMGVNNDILMPDKDKLWGKKPQWGG